MIVEHGLISFLQKFDEQPFLVKLGGKEYRIGEGEPTFTVKFNRSIPVSDLLTSTSIALGEAYMNGDLEIEGDLYDALDHFLGQMGKFSTDQNALKKLIFTSSSKKNQEKEVRAMFDEKFVRMWDLYLAACAATFHNGIIDLHQILMTKGINNDLPMVRWY